MKKKYAQDREFEMYECEAWLEHLRSMGRKENTLNTHRGNVRQCLKALSAAGRHTSAYTIDTDDIRYLWRKLEVKEEVRHAYLRSLAAMIVFYTKVDVVKEAKILYNREVCDRVFITKDDFRKAYAVADPQQKVILCLGAYMGLRRIEMSNLRDSDIDGHMLTIHGKGHGEGLVTTVRIPDPVMHAIQEYRNSEFKQGERIDDYLLQSHGRDGRLHRIHVVKISEAVTDLGKKTGVKITTHSLRRFYATLLYYDTGSDLQTLKNLMRHANVSTTLKCYVDAYDKREREATDKLTELIDGLIDQQQVRN